MVVILWGWNENRFITLDHIISFDFIEENKKLILNITENDEQIKIYNIINLIGRRMNYKESLNNSSNNNGFGSNINNNGIIINSSMGSQYFNLNKGIIIAECENDTFLIEEIDYQNKFPILKQFIKNEEFIGKTTLEIISNIEKQLSTLFSLKSNTTEQTDRKYKLILNEFKDSIIQLEKECKNLLKLSNLVNSSIKYSVIKSVKFLLKEIKFEFYHGDINIKRIELFSQLKKFLKIYFWNSNSLINSSNNNNNNNGTIEMVDSLDSISSEDINSPNDLNLSLSSFPSISSPSNSSYNNINTLTFSNNNNINNSNNNNNSQTNSSNQTQCNNINNNHGFNLNNSNIISNQSPICFNDDTSSNYTDCTNTTNITNNTNSTTTTTTTTTTTHYNNSNGLNINSGFKKPPQPPSQQQQQQQQSLKITKSPSFKIQLIQELYLEMMDQCKKIKNYLFELLENYQREEYILGSKNKTIPDRDSLSKNKSYQLAQELFTFLIKNSNDFLYQVQLLDVTETRKKTKELNIVSNQLFYSTQLLFPSISDHLDFIEMDLFNDSLVIVDDKKIIINQNNIKDQDLNIDDDEDGLNDIDEIYSTNDLSSPGLTDKDDESGDEKQQQQQQQEEEDLIQLINKVLTNLEIFSKEYGVIISNNYTGFIDSPSSNSSIQNMINGTGPGETISPKCGLFLSHSLSTDSPMGYIKRNISSISNGGSSTSTSSYTTPVSSSASLSFNQLPTSAINQQQQQLFNGHIRKSSNTSSPATMLYNSAASKLINNQSNNNVNSAESTPTFQLNLSNTMDMLNSLINKDQSPTTTTTTTTTTSPENASRSSSISNNNNCLTPNYNHHQLNHHSHSQFHLVNNNFNVGSVGNGSNHLMVNNKSIGKSFSTGNFSQPPILMMNVSGNNGKSFEENQLQFAIDNFLEVYTHLTKETVDTSIWLEEEKEDDNVYYINNTNVDDKFYKSIKYASLNQLVLKLTCESNTELRFTKTFITTYRSFTTGDTFLMKLVQRYFTPNLKNVVPYTFIQKIQIPIQLRVLNVLRLWIEQYPADFTKDLHKMLTMFLNSTRRNGHGQYSDLILKKFKQNKLKERLQLPVINNGQGIPKPKIFWMKYSTEYIFSLSSTDIAEQLTLLDFDSYKSIEEIELLNQAWSKPDSKINTPNIASMVNRFNSFSSFVAWSILRENDIKQRSKIMLKMIKICYALYKLSNFNGLLAGLAGLNTSGVYRLVHTKALIAKQYQKKFDVLCKFLDTKKSHKTYRDIIHSTCPPLIPYLGIYLTDLTFIEDGNHDEIKGLINFKKRELIYNTILEIQQYQQQGYTIKPKPSVLGFLCELPHLMDKKKFEDECYEQSILLEPKNSTKADVMNKK